MPLWVGVMGRVLGQPVSVREWASLVIGFIGVVVLMGGPSLAGEPVHLVLLMCSTIMWAIGSLLARRTRDVGGDHATLVGPALQMLTGGVILIAVSALRGEAMPEHASLEGRNILAYLFVFGSVIGFTAYAWLLHHARPVVATGYAYVNPIIAAAHRRRVLWRAVGMDHAGGQHPHRGRGDARTPPKWRAPEALATLWRCSGSSFGSRSSRSSRAAAAQAIRRQAQGRPEPGPHAARRGARRSEVR